MNAFWYQAVITSKKVGKMKESGQADNSIPSLPHAPANGTKVSDTFYFSNELHRKIRVVNRVRVRANVSSSHPTFK